MTRWAMMLGMAMWAAGSTGQVATRPDATVVVRDDPATGADLVTITMLAPEYPHATLRAIVTRIGEETKVPSRGIFVFDEAFGDRPQDKFVKATFATNGLFEPSTGRANLAALARAFAGLPEPTTIRALEVNLANFRPTSLTVNTYSDESVVVVGTQVQSPPGVQYLISLRSQDPRQIHIPLEHRPGPARAAEPAPTAPALPFAAVAGLVVVASLSFGALVYFVVLARSGGRG